MKIFNEEAFDDLKERFDHIWEHKGSSVLAKTTKPSSNRIFDDGEFTVRHNILEYWLPDVIENPHNASPDILDAARNLNNLENELEKRLSYWKSFFNEKGEEFSAEELAEKGWGTPLEVYGPSLNDWDWVNSIMLNQIIDGYSKSRSSKVYDKVAEIENGKERKEAFDRFLAELATGHYEMSEKMIAVALSENIEKVESENNSSPEKIIENLSLGAITTQNLYHTSLIIHPSDNLFDFVQDVIIYFTEIQQIVLHTQGKEELKILNRYLQSKKTDKDKKIFAKDIFAYHNGWWV